MRDAVVQIVSALVLRMLPMHTTHAMNAECIQVTKLSIRERWMCTQVRFPANVFGSATMFDMLLKDTTLSHACRALQLFGARQVRAGLAHDVRSWVSLPRRCRCTASCARH
jgi:hypothetical protein